MKTLFSFWLVLGCGAFLQAQDSPPPAQEAASASPFRSPEELDQLLGPIALYPDALIALILPATTAPADIVLAVRYLQDGTDRSQVETRAWDDSVKSLTHFAEVLNWLDRNLTWTKQVGEAFIAQPADVMNAVQRLRAKARAAGTLADTPQQQVIVQPDAISIIPAQPDVIYVPYYDPLAMYGLHSYYPNSFFSFSPAYATGLWLSYGVDWNRRRVNFVHRPDRARHWSDCRESWSRSAQTTHVPFANNRNYFRPWIPPAHSSWVSRPSRNPRPQLDAPDTARTTTYADFTAPRVQRPPYNPATPENLATHTRPARPGQWPVAADAALATPRHRNFGPSAPAYVQPPASTAASGPRLTLANPLPPPLPSPRPANEIPAQSALRNHRNAGQGNEIAGRGHRVGSTTSSGSAPTARTAGASQPTATPRLSWAPPPPASPASAVTATAKDDSPVATEKSDRNAPNARGWNRDRTGR